MLARKYRVSGHLVARIFGKGKFYRGASVGIKFLSTNNPVTRVAVVIPKKTLMKATKRNRLRRQVVDLLKPVIEARTTNTYDFVVTIYKAETPETIFGEINQWLNR